MRNFGFVLLAQGRIMSSARAACCFRGKGWQAMRVLILVLFVGVWCGASGCATGAKEAEQDIAAGHLELRTYGYPGPSRYEYGRLLEQRLNVRYVAVAGCMVTEKLVADVDAYNERMQLEIERRYGPDALRAISIEMEQRREEQRRLYYEQHPELLEESGASGSGGAGASGGEE